MSILDEIPSQGKKWGETTWGIEITKRVEGRLWAGKLPSMMKDAACHVGAFLLAVSLAASFPRPETTFYHCRVSGKTLRQCCCKGASVCRAGNVGAVQVVGKNVPGAITCGCCEVSTRAGTHPPAAAFNIGATRPELKHISSLPGIVAFPAFPRPTENSGTSRPPGPYLRGNPRPLHLLKSSFLI